MPPEQDNPMSWFPLYVDRLLTSRSVMRMTAEHFGMYIKLLCWQWKDGPLPKDADSLLMLSGGRAELLPTVLLCFKKTPAGYLNPTLEVIRKNQQCKLDEKRERGRVAANARWAKDLPDAGAMRMHCAGMPEEKRREEKRREEVRDGAALPGILPGFPVEKEPVDTAAPAKEVIEHLNRTAGTEYRPSAASHHRIINGRLKDGFTVDDLKAVVTHKVKQWQGTEMQQYLRPITLFGATKFEGYLQETKMRKPGKPLPKSLDEERLRRERLESIKLSVQLFHSEGDHDFVDNMIETAPPDLQPELKQFLETLGSIS